MTWSPEIAMIVIRQGIEDASPVTQAKVQRLIYIAHGYHLAATGEPLTGDRPEAWDYGPVYRRVADLLASNGARPIADLPSEADLAISLGFRSGLDQIYSALPETAADSIWFAYRSFAAMPEGDLAILTRGEDTPWRDVYRDGRGLNLEISHQMVRDQFASLAAKYADLVDR